MKRTGVLHATPKPFVDECFASWLQRICSRHGCSMEWLIRHIGLPLHYDFDLDLRAEHFLRIQEVTGMAAEWSFLLCDATRARENWNRYAPYRLVHRCRWCPQCFFNDREPYYRRSWRFGRGRCAVHGTPLVDQCPRCQTILSLRATFHRSAAINLAHCRCCGHWLAKACDAQTPSSRVTHPPFVDMARQRLLDQLTTQVQSVRRASRTGEPSELSGHSLFFPTGRESEQELFPTASRKPSHVPALLLDEGQFVDPARARTWRKWSSAVPRGSALRSIMAAALLMVRAELHSTRAQQADGEGQGPCAAVFANGRRA